MSAAEWQVIKPTRNAVIVTMLRPIDEEGGERFTRVVGIECADESFLPILREEAQKIVRQA